MKRFMLFVGGSDAPGGGWDDFDSDHDTLEGAQGVAEAYEPQPNWWHVVDLTTGKKVEDPAPTTPLLPSWKRFTADYLQGWPAETPLPGDKEQETPLCGSCPAFLLHPDTIKAGKCFGCQQPPGKQIKA